MGWLREDRPNHEGFAVALVVRDRCRGARLYRELQFPVDNERREDIVAVQAGCDCGWRSPYLRPHGIASWGPFSAIVSEHDDERHPCPLGATRRGFSMNAARRITLADNRATLATIPGRLVRAVFKEDTPYSDALLEVLAQRQVRWTPAEWNAALEELAASRDTVGEFLNAEHARAA